MKIKLDLTKLEMERENLPCFELQLEDSRQREKPHRTRPLWFPALVAALLLVLAQIDVFGGTLPRGTANGAAPVPPQLNSYIPDIFTQIAKSEYEIHWQPSFGAYMAPNRAQNLRFSFQDDGFSMARRDPESDEAFWTATLKLISWGNGRSPATFSRAVSSTWSVNANTARVAAQNLTIEYTNSEEGMRQNFILDKNFGGEGPLMLDFHVDCEGVKLRVDGDGTSLSFVRAKDGALVADYKDLMAYDSVGTQLPARMVDRGSEHFSIVVDDSMAIYPITIDPLIGTDGSISNPTGQNADFGFTVAYFTGHHHADNAEGGLLVGAPFFDPGGLAKAGKAFLYWCGGGSLPSAPYWTAIGSQVKEYFGWSVANAGHVRGSLGTQRYEVNSIIIGAPGYNSGSGAAFVFYGADTSQGLNFNTHSIPDWSYLGTPWESLGWSVAGWRDIDGDGWDDILIGSPSYSQGATDNGRALAFYGHVGASGGLGSSPAWTAIGPANNYEQFGTSVAFGNVNGDTHEDVVVGAPGNPTSSPGHAYIYVYSGSGLPTTATTTLSGGTVGDHFGTAVASSFDYDNDSFEDVIVGAPGATANGFSGAGMVYLYKGGSTGLGTSATWSAGGNQANNAFGSSVAGGDMNGDGYADIMVGIPNYSNVNPPTLNQDGLAYLFLASASPPHLPSFFDGVYGICNYVLMGTSVAYCPGLVNTHTNFVAGGPGGTSTCPSVVILTYSP